MWLLWFGTPRNVIFSRIRRLSISFPNDFSPWHESISWKRLIINPNIGRPFLPKLVVPINMHLLVLLSQGQNRLSNLASETLDHDRLLPT